MKNKSEFGHLCISYGYLGKAEPKREHLGGTRKGHNSQGGLIANWKKVLEAKTKLKEWYILTKNKMLMSNH